MREGQGWISESRIARVLVIVTAAAAAFFVAAYLFIAVSRLQYPFELEWIEGGMVEQVARIASGQPIYVAPSVDFVPFLYTPVYFYLSAAVARIVGIGFLPLRLVSILASLGTMALLFAMVREETGDSLAAFLAMGLFAACYRIAGSWLDIGRVDSLFLFFLMWFLYLTRRLDSLRRAMLAGLAAALAYLTKQTAAVILIPVLAALMLIQLHRAWITVAVTAAALGLVTVFLQYASAGWYGYYTFDLLRQQADGGGVSLQDFFLYDLLGRLAIGIFACTFFLILEAARDRKRFLFWSAALAGALAASLISRMKAGGFDNVLLPAYLMIALLAGLAWGRLAERWRASAPPAAGQIAGCLLLCIQFTQLLYNPLHQVPTAADGARQSAFLQYVSQLPGDVYIPYHGDITRLAGKPTYAHQSAIWDVLRGDPRNAGTLALKQSLSQAVEQHRFSAILLDGDWTFLDNLDQYYRQQPGGIPKEVVFREIVGWTVAPSDIFLPSTGSK